MNIPHRPEKLKQIQLRIMELINLAEKRTGELELRGRMEEAKTILHDSYYLCGLRQIIDVMIECPNDLHKHLAEEVDAVETTLLESWKAKAS